MDPLLLVEGLNALGGARPAEGMETGEEHPAPECENADRDENGRAPVPRPQSDPRSRDVPRVRVTSDSASRQRRWSIVWTPAGRPLAHRAREAAVPERGIETDSSADLQAQAPPLVARGIGRVCTNLSHNTRPLLPRSDR